jgi:hypothetical protein
MALVLGAFFLASAGASAAYLTVSEIFPMEMRALAIALFYAIGTAAGGIVGPYLFGQFVHSGNIDQVATGFFIGAGAMALGGVAELIFGVRAEGRSLEEIAAPLSAARGERIRRRADERRTRDTDGLRRFRPGPGHDFGTPGMLGGAGDVERDALAEQALDREIEAIEQAAATGTVEREELENRVHAREWGPGRFDPALREALREGRVTRLRRGTYGPGRRRGPGRDR